LRIINYGRIGGTGKFVILPVDQGFEHGPSRSFLPQPSGFDPRYHARLAVDGGCNAYAAPKGALAAAADLIAKEDLPTILKVNSHDLLMPDASDPFPAITSWVDDALELGCAAVGFSIYSGSVHSREMYDQARQLAQDARDAGLIVVLWAYPRGSGLPSKAVETAVDVVCYGVHIAAQLGAHIIKCKPTIAKIGLPDHVRRETFKDVAIDTLAARTRLVMQSAFDGHRIVINSGGPAKGTEAILDEIRQLKDGGSFGSIVGRNTFQRPLKAAIELLHKIQDIHVS
jgi:class I fructose-bisphosphate aldolase